MSQGFDAYSAKRVKSALLHFLLGKTFSGLCNAALLILYIRHLTQAEYGTLVVLLGLQATLLAVSTLGIEPTLERFLPELRVAGKNGEVVTLVIGGLIVRLAVLCLAILICWFVVDWIVSAIGLPIDPKIAGWFLFVVVLNGFLNTSVAVLDSLLLQSASQIAAAVHALVRLAAVMYFINGPGLALRDVVSLEMGAAFVASVVALLLFFRRHGARNDGASITHAIQALVPYRTRLAKFATMNYLAQVTMQAYGTEAIRVAVTRVLGIADTARYGLAATLMDLANRYLPAFLLVRLIRPVFVSRYAANRDFAQLNAFAIMVLKLNLLVVFPLIGIALLRGDAVVALISAGKYPHEGMILVAALVLLVPTSHQWVISVTANTIERNDLQVKGALLAAIGFPIGVLLMLKIGIWGAFCGAYVSATLYNSYAVWYLRRAGFAYKQDIKSIAKMSLATAIAVFVGFVLPPMTNPMVDLVVVGAVGGAVYLSVLFFVKPFSNEERKILGSVLPAKLVRFL